MSNGVKFNRVLSKNANADVNLFDTQSSDQNSNGNPENEYIENNHIEKQVSIPLN